MVDGYVFFCFDFVSGWLKAEATESESFTHLETNILLMEEIRLTIWDV